MTIQICARHSKRSPTWTHRELQKSKAHLVVHASMAKPSDSDPVTIWVSLEDSYVSSGPMFYRETYSRGFFQDHVTVRMRLDGASAPQLLRVSDGPQTANGSGSTSSSVSVTFSAGGNVGFFGPTPTGGANIGVAASDSKSFSRNLTDFRIINTSTDHMAVHEYRMSMSGGKVYDKPVDLWPTLGVMDVYGAALGNLPSFYEPPDLATSNLPLLSQCLWQANHTRDIKDTVSVSIEIVQRVVWVRMEGIMVVPTVKPIVHHCKQAFPLGNLVSGLPAPGAL